MLIAVDEKLLAELQATLEAVSLQMIRLEKRLDGNEPLTLKQAAAYLHVSYTTLREYIRKEQITPSEYGSRVWVTRNELDNFIARHRRK